LNRIRFFPAKTTPFIDKKAVISTVTNVGYDPNETISDRKGEFLPSQLMVIQELGKREGLVHGEYRPTLQGGLQGEGGLFPQLSCE
jgi:hypothetical protein